MLPQDLFFFKNNDLLLTRMCLIYFMRDANQLTHSFNIHIVLNNRRISMGWKRFYIHANCWLTTTDFHQFSRVDSLQLRAMKRTHKSPHEKLRLECINHRLSLDTPFEIRVSNIHTVRFWVSLLNIKYSSIPWSALRY